MKRLFFQLHLWLSIPAGIIISLICFSGAMLVFEKEITALLQHDLRKADQSAGSPLPISDILDTVGRTLPEGVEVTGVEISPDPAIAYSVNLSYPNRASLWVDQYTGNINGPGKRPAFFRLMFEMHRWLLDSKRPADGSIWWGKTIVGIATLAMLIILATGLLLWWPRSRKTLHRSLSIPLRKGWPKFWLGLHDAAGAYAALFLIAMAVTGLTWSFRWYNDGFYRLFGVAKTESARKHGGGKAEAKEISYIQWQTVYDLLAAANEGRTISISDGKASVQLKNSINSRAADKYTFNPRNGEITGSEPYAALQKSSKMRGIIYSVHTGSWGGIITRILAFLAAITGAILPVTGYYLWLRRILRHKHTGVSPRSNGGGHGGMS